jgi:hypothetical protein
VKEKEKEGRKEGKEEEKEAEATENGKGRMCAMECAGAACAVSGKFSKREMGQLVRLDMTRLDSVTDATRKKKRQ